MSARDTAPPRAQNVREEDSPFRKVISVLQVCTNRLVISLAHYSHPANRHRLRSDAVG